MPTIRMPDGAQVQFPDDMPREQIRDMIVKKFPTAAFGESGKQVGEFGRNLTTGFREFGAQVAPFVPGLTGPLTEAYSKSEKEKIKDEPQSAGRTIGNIAPTLLVPGFGLEGLAMKGLGFAPGAATRIASRVIGSIGEGAAGGAVGGALTPSESAKETVGNALTGAAAGAGLRGAGTIGNTAIRAIPLEVKNTLAGLAAVAALNKLGLPWWSMFMHPGWSSQQHQNTGSIFNKLYNSNLADLARRYLQQGTRFPPATVGAGAAQVRENTGRNNEQ